MRIISSRAPWFSSAIAAGFIAVVAAPQEAEAHFILTSPPSWMSQDALGAPEKLGPCGDELDNTGEATASNTVTAFQQGQTITITVNEVVFHPGHYRIALALNDRSELPAEPAVTAGAQACGTAEIQSPVVFPVLADDVFDHTTEFTSPQSVQITLPADVTCTHCTLQVIEFMSDHGLNVPGGCFYHHCADISIQTGPVMTSTTVVASSDATSGAGGSTDGTSSSTGGCALTAGEGAPETACFVLALGALAGITRRRRQRR